ncbi:hypothetical protein Fmac_005808 [Flemingia macrophylla]|uniref:Uncharacterized protein n=1 Tax=Flemingia macrophylla TaxID=520843 RepID=A0ABD1NA75_9FABA
MHSCSMEVKVCWVRVAEVDEEEVDVVGVRVYFEENTVVQEEPGSSNISGSSSSKEQLIQQITGRNFFYLTVTVQAPRFDWGEYMFLCIVLANKLQV